MAGGNHTTWDGAKGNASNSGGHAERRWIYIALGIIPLWILFGNLMVLLAVLWHRSLQTLSNWVIASLAATDFLLALIVVPFGIYQLVNGSWDLGLYVCLLWTGSDVFLSTTSILHLCAIALHRCMGIAMPLRMRSRQNKRHVVALLLPVWGVSLAIALPLVVMGLIDQDPVLVHIPNVGLQCGIFHRTFAVYSSLVSFFVPLAIMVVADIRSVVILRQNVISTRRRSPTPRSLTSRASSDLELKINDIPAPGNPKLAVSATSSGGHQQFTNGHRRPSRVAVTSAAACPSYLAMLSGRAGLTKTSSRERRAERTLVWVFIVFVLLWMPFFVTNLTYGICRSCAVPGQVFTAFTWLGYISSGVNPAIYTVLNRDFRRAFRLILLCRRAHIGRKSVPYL